ncbi:hypothetical protein C8Q76DRAFT_790120 [Earliella scabrosa]|nr:hypothetical protein C8Q76DRAFT_790120 [Earliella scabrosa]
MLSPLALSLLHYVLYLSHLVYRMAVVLGSLSMATYTVALSILVVGLVLDQLDIHVDVVGAGCRLFAKVMENFRVLSRVSNSGQTSSA